MLPKNYKVSIENSHGGQTLAIYIDFTDNPPPLPVIPCTPDDGTVEISPALLVDYKDSKVKGIEILGEVPERDIRELKLKLGPFCGRELKLVKCLSSEFFGGQTKV